MRVRNYYGKWTFILIQIVLPPTEIDNKFPNEKYIALKFLVN
jgi:hypothetical protein